MRLCWEDLVWGELIIGWTRTTEVSSAAPPAQAQFEHVSTFYLESVPVWREGGSQSSVNS